MANNLKMSSGAIAVLSVLVLLTGMLNTTSTKVLFSQYSTGRDGKTEKFTKPWFAAWNMLSAMLLVGIIDTVYRRIGMALRPSLPIDAEVPLVNGNGSAPEKSGYSYMQKVLLVAVPGCFDLVATGLMWIGLLHIPASITNILRGSCIVFTAIFARIVFNRQILCFQLVGLLLCMTGIVIVGLAESLGSAASTSGDRASSMFGMTMVILAQIVQAIQLVGEEWLMKGVDLPGMAVIGWEGFWGCVAMIVVVYPLLYALPGSDHGHMEDAFDTYYQIKNSSTVQGLALMYVFTCATFNATGIAITGALSAVHRVILIAITTLLIWAFALFVHYFYDSTSEFGEAWTSYSHIKLIGFFVLLVGQAVYGQMIKVPGMKYPPMTGLHPQPQVAHRAAAA